MTDKILIDLSVVQQAIPSSIYTHPQPKRQPLSDEQIDEMWREATLKPALTSEFVHAFARAIERAILEKVNA